MSRDVLLESISGAAVYRELFFRVRNGNVSLLMLRPTTFPIGYDKSISEDSEFFRKKGNFHLAAALFQAKREHPRLLSAEEQQLGGTILLHGLGQ